MVKFNNVYCTLCAMIYLQLLGCYGEVLRNITKEFDQMLIKFDQQEEKFNQMFVKVDQLEKKLKNLTENCNEGMLK